MRTEIALGIVLVGFAFGGAAPVQAQDSVLAELYGYGVHAYFANQYEQAHDYLTTAVEQGTLDPRVYYFRGLTYSRLGRPDEAKADFQRGAELETAGADRVYPIGRSLQRVQGRARIELERYRHTARLVARTRDMKAKQARYEQLKNAEGEVLRDPNRPPPAAADELVGPPAADAANDPFADDAAEPAPAAAPAAAAPATPPAGDLFGDTPDEPAAPAATEPEPADDDPFGAPADPADDPFGAPPAGGDPDDDPFGAPADGMPAADDDPFS